MLTPILATEDPYQAAARFIAAGWSLIFQTPPEDGDPLACVGLAGAQVMLGTALPQFLPPDARPHRGAGVEFHLSVPAAQIDAIFQAHRAHAESVTDLALQPWGEQAFHAVLDGYRFLIAAQPPPAEPARSAHPARPDQAGSGRDWVAWHHGYDNPSSSLSARLARVRWHLSEAISGAGPGPVQILSLCAGQGHDVLDVLPAHPRREDVRALLVEADATNARVARERAAAAGLARVYVRQADASLVASFADVLPADVLLLCGIFGNVSESDIKRTVDTAAALCSNGATVIWTRHRRPPDLTPRLRAWFAGNGFDEVAFDALDTEVLTGVGVHRLRSGQPRRGYSDDPLFTFGSART